MKNYAQHIRSGFIPTGLMFALFLYFNINQPLNELLVASIYFIILYLLLFTIGRPEIVTLATKEFRGGTEKALIFPVLLVAMLYFYLIYHEASPFQGTAALFPFFVLFPVLGFLAFRKTTVVWSDFVFLLLLLIPAVSISFKNSTGMPVNGNGFSSVYKLIIMLIAVYAFAIIRGINDVGFYLAFQWRSLGIAVASWLGFIGIVLLIAVVGGFLNINTPGELSEESAARGVRNFIRIFIGTALFEELFFRGLIQNMLAKKFGQISHWFKSWLWSFIIFAMLALLTGVLINKGLVWFPLAITVILFAAAYFIEKTNATPKGTYISLAVTSIFFGLVHFHAGSVIFVGLAALAGWFYGYTYLKTRNVFYAALVHTLVNSSEFLFALDGLK